MEGRVVDGIALIEAAMKRLPVVDPNKEVATLAAGRQGRSGGNSRFAKRVVRT